MRRISAVSSSLYRSRITTIKPSGGLHRRQLLCRQHAQRHARPVRHATQEDLDHLEALLLELRKLPELRERERGYFSRGSRAFLHFHEDAGDLYVDVRLDRQFQRMKVTTPAEQAVFLSRVRAALQPNS
jgi:hypothetical protein